MACFTARCANILPGTLLSIFALAIPLVVGAQTTAPVPSMAKSNQPVRLTTSARHPQAVSAPGTVSRRTESGSAFPAPLFLPGLLYGPVGYQDSVVVGDVNGDGKLDVVAATYEAIQVFLGNGDGTLAPAVSYPALEGPLVLADLTGKGKLDVVVAGSSLNVLLGNGDGTFGSPVPYTSVANITGLAVADVNGDGKPDIVVVEGAAEVDNLLAVLLGNGDGTFQSPVSYDSGGSGFDPTIAIADMNGDGKPDLLVANACTPATGCDPAFPSPTSVGIMLGNGDGTFQPAVNYLSQSGGSCGEPNSGGPLYVADLNGDGKLDVVVLSQGCGIFSVMLGNGDGTLQSGVSYSPPNSSTGLAIADANGDGVPDLLVPIGAWNSPTSIAVYEGKGDGTFQSPSIVPTNGGLLSASGVAAGDLNGDGKPDLVVTGGNISDISVLMNNTGGVPPSTALASSPSVSGYGENVTLTATVSSTLAVPTGTVNFLDGATVIGSSSLSNGIATLQVSSLTAGSHSLTAAYQGSGSFYPNTSSRISQVVRKATTTVVVTSSADPRLPNKPFSLYATVNSQYGAFATGTVTFTANSETIGTASVFGWGEITASLPVDGTYSIVATYSGDANNRARTSPPFTQYIDSVDSQTILTVSPSPSIIGQPVTFTADVTSKKVSVPNGDMVTFYYGSTLVGSAKTIGGLATFTTTAIPYGDRTLSADFAGDSVLLPSVGHFQQNIERWPTSTTLTSSLNPSGPKATFTATVNSTGPNMATGKVGFFDQYGLLGFATLSSGVATFEGRNLPVGSDPITAEYEGDSNSAQSTSSVLTQVVN